MSKTEKNSQNYYLIFIINYIIKKLLKLLLITTGCVFSKVTIIGGERKRNKKFHFKNCNRDGNKISCNTRRDSKKMRTALAHRRQVSRATTRASPQWEEQSRT